MDHIIDLFRFYPNNKLIFDWIVQDMQRKNGIMPFIGEELIKCIFGSRKEFVDEVQKKTPNNFSLNYDLSSTSSLSFLDMLDNLIGIHEKGVIDKALLSFYSENKIDDKYIKNQPICLVPYINGKHCITINIDSAIDHSYRIAEKKADVTHPFQRRKLNTLVRGGLDSSQTNIILKIHGDILSDTNQRIISKEDYQTHYAKSSDFYSIISMWLQTYTILFIGIDICKESYLFDLLRESKSSGSYHYAIIACPDNQEKKKQTYDTLQKIGILPILYDESKPEHIEILIHKLLIDSNNIPKYPLRELDYRYSHQDLVGRKEQIELLESFIKREDRFLWTILCGTKHCGRTKLAYDFSRQYASDWEWYILEPEEIDDFLCSQKTIQDARRRNRKLLIVFDDFHWYKGSINKILNSEVCLNLHCIKVRLIFVICNINSFKQNVMDEFSNNTDKNTLSKIMDSAFHSIVVGKLNVEEIIQLCHGYIQYRASQLKIQDNLKEIFALIDAELHSYVQELNRLEIPDILLYSQLKAINLVKQVTGAQYLNDSELAELLFQLTVTIDRPPVNTIDFNFEKWWNDTIEREQNAKYTKEFFNNKENHSHAEQSVFIENTAITRMLTNLCIDNYNTNEKGDDKNE